MRLVYFYYHNICIIHMKGVLYMSLSEKTQAIYMIRNKLDNRVYIGSTKDVTQRFKQYICAVNEVENNPSKASKHNAVIADIAKLGWDNFEFKIIDASVDMQNPDLRSIREVELIMKYRSIFPKYGYNATMGGETGTKGHRTVGNFKPKALILYDTMTEECTIYLKGTKTVPDEIGIKANGLPTAVQRGYLMKNRYFAFYANTERMELFHEYVVARRSVEKTNGSNDKASKERFKQYEKAYKAAYKCAQDWHL